MIRAVVKNVVPAVYKQQKAEGTFRYDHAWLRTHSESVVFCGVEAVEGRERDRLGASFDAVVLARYFFAEGLRGVIAGVVFFCTCAPECWLAGGGAAI